MSQETELARLQYERDVFRQERDFYKMQYQSLKSQRDVGSGGSLTSGSLPGATVTSAGAPATTATTTAGVATSPTGLGPTTTTAGGVPGVGTAAGSPRGVGAVGAPPPRPLSVPIGSEYISWCFMNFSHHCTNFKVSLRPNCCHLFVFLVISIFIPYFSVSQIPVIYCFKFGPLTCVLTFQLLMLRPYAEKETTSGSRWSTSSNRWSTSGSRPRPAELPLLCLGWAWPWTVTEALYEDHSLGYSRLPGAGTEPWLMVLVSLIRYCVFSFSSSCDKTFLLSLPTRSPRAPLNPPHPWTPASLQGHSCGGN